MKRINNGKNILFYRDNEKWDYKIVVPVFMRDEYFRHGLTLTSDDVVLDIGANIGTFVVKIADQVKAVIAYEPEETNFRLMKLNCLANKFTNVRLVQACVVGDDTEVVRLYLSGVPYLHSTLVSRRKEWVDCPAERFSNIIKQYGVTKVKIDCEGSELPILMGCDDFAAVQQIALEYDFNIHRDTDNAKFNTLIKHLASHGFDITPMQVDRKKNWNKVYVIHRKL